MQLPQPPPCWRNDAQTANNGLTLQQQKQQQQMLRQQHQQYVNRSYSNMSKMPNICRPIAPSPAIANNIITMPLMQSVPPPHMPTYPQPGVFPPSQVTTPPAIATAPQRNEKCFTPESLNQKGAFIPLQAQRNNAQVSPNNNTNKTAADEAKVAQVQQNLSNIALSNSTPSTDVSGTPNQQLNATSATIPNNSKLDARKKTPRVPKIGARFDNAH